MRCSIACGPLVWELDSGANNDTCAEIAEIRASLASRLEKVIGSGMFERSGWTENLAQFCQIGRIKRPGYVC